MINDVEFFHTKSHLKTGEGAARILHALDYAIDILEVLPNEEANTGIFGDSLVGTIRLAIIGVGSLNREIIDKRNGDMRDFRLENMGDVFVKNRN
jgi:hypothetical protein